VRNQEECRKKCGEARARIGLQSHDDDDDDDDEISPNINNNIPKCTSSKCLSLLFVLEK
jgi:hypothetical protein